MAISLDSLIESTPGICGGKPRIAGHRIRVIDVVVWQQKLGWTPEEMIGHYPQLTLADIHAALAYYWANKEEVDQSIVDSEAIVAESVKMHPSKVGRKLEEIRDRPDKISP